jgi:hypothetical protein
MLSPQLFALVGVGDRLFVVLMTRAELGALGVQSGLERLAVHFRTSPSAVGPTLRRVELWNGSNVEFRIDTLIQGDYMTKNLTKPEVVANVWIFAARNVSAQSVVRLEIQSPGGFEGTSNPGEFVLAGVDADFPRRPAGDTLLQR